MPFNIIRDDIINLEVDAVVNATNSNLQAGGGVCGAIFAAAGKEQLQEECDKIGFCGIGEAVITKGYNLKAHRIIHTVGPIYGQNPANQESQLYLCYENSLKLAKKEHLNSIAFPIISSGVYGYPKDEAIKIATKAIKDFLATNEMDVFLVVYDQNSFQISKQLFDNVKSYIDERLVKPDLRSRFCALQSNVYRPTEKYPKNSEDLDVCKYEPPQESFGSCEYSIENFQVSPISLQDLLNKKSETFSEMLFRLIDKKGMSDVEVYKKANIDRKLFSKIRKKDYTPKKATVIALAISLKLNLNETKDLLGQAGFALSNWNKFDIIIQYFIENKNYDIFEINETLFAFQQQLLGS